MRLTLHLRGIDLIDVEFHAGSKGVFLDLDVFKPRDAGDGDKPATAGPIEATSGGQFERAEPMEAPDTTVRFGFGGAA